MSELPTILFYTRPGCHLCEDASAVLVPLAQRYGFEVKAIDIMHDKAAHDRWWHSIPVVVIGDTILTAPIESAELQHAVAGAAAIRA